MLPQEHAFLEAIEKIPKKDQAFLIKVKEFAMHAHEGQMRKDGKTPYIVHPLEVATHLQKNYHYPFLTASGLLHDVVEDCDVRMDEIYTLFGEEVGFYVDSITKDAPTFLRLNVTFEDKMEKLLWGGMQDIGCLLLKIADRESNLGSIENLKDAKQVRMSFETQAIYLPLKYILSRFCVGKFSKTWNDKLSAFLLDHGIETPKAFAQYLYNDTFEELDKELFELVYANSDKIVWEVTDIHNFQRLCENENFEKSAKIILLEYVDHKFRSYFQYNKGHLLPEDETKMRVASFQVQT